jgi:hypothetical protein
MKNKTKIIGRIEECKRLDKCMRADSAQLVIVYGRRRVGKTYLINQYFENQFAFKVTGIFAQNKETQLRNFITELDFRTKEKHNQPKDWYEAFGYLRNYIEELPKDTKQVLFFDEMPWMDTQKSDFLPSFEWFWNHYASTIDNIVVVVCGSATSWMDEKIENNKGGLFNRQTGRLYLEPFKLHEVEKYLVSRGINWSRRDIAECYMVMGGIPYYLSLLDSQLSYKQNIDALFFKKKGELWDEFEHLYRTLFTNSDNYIKVVEALSEKRGGLTRNEIIKKAKLPAGGDVSKIINNLLISGFIRVSGFYNKKKKDALYQLADYYTLFYFRYIKNNYGKDEHFWLNATDNPTMRVWAGLTFEQVCMDHILQIKHKLGISGVLSEESSWFVAQDEENGVSGAQIDLLIDRRDGVVSICEMKHSINEFEIDKKYDMNLRNKIGAFVQSTKCKKTIQVVMITTYGVKENMYSSIVNSQVVLDDLFYQM